MTNVANSQMKTPAFVYKIFYNIASALIIALFVMFFVILYRPTFGNEMTELALWQEHASLCLPIISAIVLLTVAVSRALLIVLTRCLRLTNIRYFLWLLGEVIASLLFINLFLTLRFSANYFDLLPVVFSDGFLILLLPYIILWFYMRAKAMQELSEEVEKTVTESKTGISNQESQMVRFADERGNIKLVVGLDLIVAVEAAANYVVIVYVDDDNLLRYSLRNTLKNVEPLCERSGLTRCHRSYFVNLNKVKLLRREGETVYAEMNVRGYKDIPISRAYVSAVTQRFSQVAEK